MLIKRKKQNKTMVLNNKPTNSREDSSHCRSDLTSPELLSCFSFRELQMELQTVSAPAPTNAPFYTLRILILVCCYMFLRNRHLQGVYTNVVKTYRNKIVLQ